MTKKRLTLSIRNVDVLENGLPARVEFAQRGAIIGRAPTADWRLPDPRAFVSSRHCEILYASGQYRLSDVSTNGTFVNGAAHRLSTQHVLADGDLIQIGDYEIVATISGGTLPARPPVEARNNKPEGPAPEPVGPPSAGWTDIPVPAVGAANGGALAAAPSRDRPADADAADVWARLVQANAIELPRNAPDSAPASFADLYTKPPLAFASLASEPPASVPASKQVTLAPVASQASSYALPSAPLVPVPAQADPAVTRFLNEAGLSRSALNRDDIEIAAAAGGLLRRLVAGLFVLLEARARAKAQMGAQATIVGREGNNAIKFSRSPEEALARLLNQPISGFMAAERSVDDSFEDLQSHQMATLKAMQGALRATLDRFSPAAIRGRAKKKGLLARILPGAHDATLWQAYEQEFSGVAEGSDEAFMDVFAREFRKAYEDLSA